jgi:hypothetical protein
MSARVDLQGIPAGYFIDQGGALGVMTGQYTLLEYQTAGFFSQVRRVFSLTVFMDYRIGILCGFCTKGIVFHVFQDVILVSVPWLHPRLP